MRKIVCGLLSLLVFVACVRINPQDGDIIALTVILQSNNEYVGRIALVNYSTGELIKYVTSNNDNARKAHFSPDKKKLLIEFSTGGTPSEFGVYDIESDSLSKFQMNGYDGQIYSVIGNQPIWNSSSNGFYYSINYKNIYYYDFTTQNFTTIHQDNNIDNDVYCIDLMSDDSLIVFSNKYYRENNDSNCIFIMSPTGEYLSQITNPHFELINKDGITVKGASYLNWNSSTRRFIYSAIDSSYSGFKISVTDYNGTFNEEYTDLFYDKLPIWGPQDIIFFHRPNEEYDEDEAYVLDTKTRKVSKLSDKIQISRAVFLSDPTY